MEMEKMKEKEKKEGMCSIIFVCKAIVSMFFRTFTFHTIEFLLARRR